MMNASGRGIGVFRVWRKGMDYPGLAMSRSLGDKLAQDCGVSWEPAIKSLLLDFERNNYILVNASDGIWDGVTEAQVKRVVGEVLSQQKSVEQACT